MNIFYQCSNNMSNPIFDKYSCMGFVCTLYIYTNAVPNPIEMTKYPL